MSNLTHLLEEAREEYWDKFAKLLWPTPKEREEVNTLLESLIKKAYTQGVDDAVDFLDERSRPIPSTDGVYRGRSLQLKDWVDARAISEPSPEK